MPDAREIPGLQALWAKTLGDSQICVAILDGLVDQAHPCFQGANLTRLPSLVQGEASADGKMSIHGTHVASVIFGQHGSQVQGIAPLCRGLIIPVFPDAGRRPSQLDIARAIEQAVHAGAHIINISGGQLTDYGEADGILEKAVLTYAEMSERIVTAVRSGLDVCAVYYGHPGVFVTSAHNAIRIARAEGFEAQMLPGISAEDCLFADLGIDPGNYGCQSYEATKFLLYRLLFDPRSTLVLWQVGAIGMVDYDRTYFDQNKGIDLLVETLLESYPADHQAIIYEATQNALFSPRIEPVAIGKLAESVLTLATTLVIPPDPKSSIPDMERAKQLGLEEHIDKIKELQQREF
ncbi:SAM-dependent methyltransferase [Nostoc sp.]|uniref:SAM-dependent methyltransferase n=1 Tax=Nostoc sp. TaxID=1180 RepID=UPI002FF8E819